MRTRRVFDVAVIGGSTSALVAACLLRRKGYKVIHIEHDGLAGRYHHEGRDLPIAPELFPSPRRSPVIAGVLEELALLNDAQRRLTAIPALQVLSPGRRFSLPFEPEAQKTELCREFGEASGSRAAAQIAALLEADAAASALLAEHPPLPPDGLFERRALRRLAAVAPRRRPPLEALPELEAVFQGLSRIGSYVHCDPLPPLQQLRTVAGFFHGIFRSGPDLEPGGYASLLRHRFDELGGERASPQTRNNVGGESGGIVERLGVSGGKINTVEVLDDASEYHPRFVISGLEVAALRRLLPLDARRRKFDARLGSIRPREILFSLNLVLRAHCLPPGLANTALYLDKPGDGEPPGLLLLQRFRQAGHDGEEVLQVSTFVPAARREQGRAFFEQEGDRLLEVLRSDLLPFLDEGLLLRSAPLLEDGDRRGARLCPHPRLETDLELALGVGLLPPSTPYKNLVLAGRENVPGLGLEGEFLAGHRAARIIAEQARRHDPLRH